MAARRMLRLWDVHRLARLVQFVLGWVRHVCDRFLVVGAVGTLMPMYTPQPPSEPTLSALPGKMEMCKRECTN